MRIDKDVPMTARDGVVLRADVYRPDGPGRFPVPLSRLPYDKNGRRRSGDIDVFVEHNYVVIMQDTRGRFASEGGEYEPLVWEAQDGHDAVEWAAQLPYADGNVGTMGQSSSNFPRFDRNLNTGEDQATGTRWQTARQTIFHDARYPSHLMLPIIPR